MKEKTFKDLGLDDGDKYLEQMAGVLDLAGLEDILNEKDDEEKLEKKMKYKDMGFIGKTVKNLNILCKVKK